MKALTSLLALSLIWMSPVQATEIKSVDGRVINAEIEDMDGDSIKIKKGGEVFWIAWDKIDPEQAKVLKRSHWIVDEKDRFTKKRTIRTKDLVLAPGVDISGHILSAEKPSEISYLLLLSRVADSWRWMSYHDTRTLIDDEPGPTGTGKCSTDVFKSGNVYESVSIIVSPAEMEKLAKAKKFEVRVGDQELDVPPSRLNVLKALFEVGQEILKNAKAKDPFEAK